MKKWIYVIAVVIIGVGAFVCYSLTTNNSTTIAVDDASKAIDESVAGIADAHSNEDIKIIFAEIFSEGEKMDDDNAVKKFFSKEFKEFYAKVDEYDKEHSDEGIGFWDETVWGYGNDEYESCVIKDVQYVTESTVSAFVEYVSGGEKYLTKFQLIYENGEWVIDEVIPRSRNGFKQEMKKYLDYVEEEAEQQAETINNLVERNIYQEKMYIINGFFERYIENYADLRKCAEMVKEYCTEEFAKRYMRNIQGANSIDIAVCGRPHQPNESFGASVSYADLIEDNKAKVDFTSETDGREFSWYVTLDPKERRIADIKASEK